MEIFKKISAKGAIPKETGWYDTNLGRIFFGCPLYKCNDGWYKSEGEEDEQLKPLYWLEPYLGCNQPPLEGEVEEKPVVRESRMTELMTQEEFTDKHARTNEGRVIKNAAMMYQGYIIGFTKAKQSKPAEGDVRDAKELIYQIFDDMFKSFDKSISQKIKQVAEDGDGEVHHSAYWKSCGLYDSKAIVKRLFANSVNNDTCKPLFALLSKFNFTRKG